MSKDKVDSVNQWSSSENNANPDKSEFDQNDRVDHGRDELPRRSRNANERLTPIEPSEAINIYIDDRKIDLQPSSLKSHKSALRYFEQYCENEEIQLIGDLTGRDLHNFKVWRNNEGNEKEGSLAPTTLRNQLNIVKQFLKKCEEIDAVPQEFHEKVPVIDSSAIDDSRDEILETDHAESILKYLERFHYAGLPHVVFKLLTATGIREGTLLSLDVEDVDLGGDFPTIKPKDRPDTGTRLKNDDRGERIISLDESTGSVLSDYLSSRRPEVTDSFGRKPLITTGHGRIAPATVRRIVNKWSSPCQIDNECPVGRDSSECEAVGYDSFSKCPVSISPHDIRRGYMTHELRNGVTRTVVSGRCDVSEEVIEKHYDKRSEQERTRVRRDALSEVHQSASPYGGD